MKNIFLFLFFVSLLVSCSRSEESAHALLDVASKEMVIDAPSNNLCDGADIIDANIPKDRKFIWTGNLSFQVKDVTKSSDTINKICSQFGGFVSGMQMNSNTYQIDNRITIRVKSSNFQPLMNAIKSESIFLKNVEVSSQDVTEEYVDVESRLASKREVRDRYIEILKTKTGDVKDVIEAEEAIRTITEEIEAKEGRLRFLKDQVEFCTIHVHVFQEVEYRETPSMIEITFLDKVTAALGNGWSFIVNLFVGLLNIWPLILVISLLVWRRKAIIAKFRKKK